MTKATISLKRRWRAATYDMMINEETKKRKRVRRLGSPSLKVWAREEHDGPRWLERKRRGR
jgi:hypothetical protein